MTDEKHELPPASSQPDPVQAFQSLPAAVNGKAPEPAPAADAPREPVPVVPFIDHRIGPGDRHRLLAACYPGSEDPFVAFCAETGAVPSQVDDWLRGEAELVRCFAAVLAWRYAALVHGRALLGPEIDAYRQVSNIVAGSAPAHILTQSAHHGSAAALLGEGSPFGQSAGFYNLVQQITQRILTAVGHRSVMFVFDELEYQAWKARHNIPDEQDKRARVGFATERGGAIMHEATVAARAKH